MTHVYSKFCNIPSTGLRFFTINGSADCSDMTYFGCTNKLREGKAIQIFNYGNCKRDFTYVNDIVAGGGSSHHATRTREAEWGGRTPPPPPYKVYNIGNDSPESTS